MNILLLLFLIVFPLSVFADNDDRDQYPYLKNFTVDFEDAKDVKDLIWPSGYFNGMTLQSQQAKSVVEYVELSQKIASGEEDFRDSRIDIVRKPFVYSGEKALRFHAAPRSKDMVTAKTFMNIPFLDFKEGDHFWYSAWYYVDGDAYPHGIVDLEATQSNYHGMRLLISESGYLHAELKTSWPHKTKYSQSRGEKIHFPKNQWVHVKFHCLLKADNSGVVQVWQDNQLIIDKAGRTIPKRRAVMDALEIGISAHSYGDAPAVLIMDNIVVSDQEGE